MTYSNLEGCQPGFKRSFKEIFLFFSTQVLRGERRGAEIDYLKQNCKEWLESGGSRDANNSQPSEAFVTSHPTYEKLLESK